MSLITYREASLGFVKLLIHSSRRFFFPLPEILMSVLDVLPSGMNDGDDEPLTLGGPDLLRQVIPTSASSPLLCGDFSP